MQVSTFQHNVGVLCFVDATTQMLL